MLSNNLKTINLIFIVLIYSIYNQTISLSQELSTNDLFKQASQNLEQNNLSQAKKQFKELLKTTNIDDNRTIASIYYNLAIISTKENNLKEALEFYALVYNLRPNSKIGKYSINQIQAINKLNSSTYSNKNNNNLDNPLELTVPIILSKDGLPLLNIMINQIPTMAVFDSGASDFIINRKLANQIGLNLQHLSPNAQVTGSGSKNNNKAWSNFIDFQCNLIHYQNFPVLITNENFPLIPVLGSNCMGNYDYFLDKDNLKLHLTLKNSSKTSTVKNINSMPFNIFTLDNNCKYQFKIPFFFDQNNLIVINVKINNVNCPMTLDTGASTSMFTYDLIKKYNLKLTLLNDHDTHWGVSGSCKSQTCNINTLSIGPLILNNLKASVTSQSNAKRPLLGSDALRNWLINVDKVNMVITFKQD